MEIFDPATHFRITQVDFLEECRFRSLADVFASTSTLPSRLQISQWQHRNKAEVENVLLKSCMQAACFFPLQQPGEASQIPGTYSVLCSVGYYRAVKHCVRKQLFECPLTWCRGTCQDRQTGEV